MYICVDFDGTCVDHAYPEIGKPVPYALDVLKYWQERGVRLILFTMRSGCELEQAVQYLEQNGICLYGINHNPDQDSWTTSPKAYGNYFVDDAAVGCPLINLEGFNRPCVDWKRVYDIMETVVQFAKLDRQSDI